MTLAAVDTKKKMIKIQHYGSIQIKNTDIFLILTQLKGIAVKKADPSMKVHLK